MVLAIAKGGEAGHDDKREMHALCVCGDPEWKLGGFDISGAPTIRSVSGPTRTLTLNYFKGSKQTRGGARQKGEDVMRPVHRAVAL